MFLNMNCMNFSACRLHNIKPKLHKIFLSNGDRHSKLLSNLRFCIHLFQRAHVTISNGIFLSYKNFRSYIYLGLVFICFNFSINLLFL